MKPYEVDMRPGDTIRVSLKVKEGEKTRTQVFEGLVLAHKHGRGVNGTITVRKVSFNIGVERVFPLHSPAIEKIEIVRRASRVRRARLYYIRDRAAKEMRRKMKQVRFEAPPEALEVKEETEEVKEKETEKAEAKA